MGGRNRTCVREREPLLVDLLVLLGAAAHGVLPDLHGRAPAVAALRFTAGRSKQNPTTWPHCVETGTEFSNGLFYLSSSARHRLELQGVVRPWSLAPTHARWLPNASKSVDAAVPARGTMAEWDEVGAHPILRVLFFRGSISPGVVSERNQVCRLCRIVIAHPFFFLAQFLLSPSTTKNTPFIFILYIILHVYRARLIYLEKTKYLIL